MYVPSSELGLPKPPAPLSECAPSPSPEPKSGGAHSPTGGGLWSPNSDYWRKSLALCLLCDLKHLLRMVPGTCLALSPADNTSLPRPGWWRFPCTVPSRSCWVSAPRTWTIYVPSLCFQGISFASPNHQGLNSDSGSGSFRERKHARLKGAQVWKFSSHGFFLFLHHKASMGRWL